MNGHLAIAGLAPLVSAFLGMAEIGPIRPIEGHRETAVQIAQLSYKGYMSCQNARGSCEVELNRKKSEIKRLCRSIWSGYWPERAELDPSAIAMYTNWCETAKSDIYYALSEYPNLVGFISRYKDFNPGYASDEDVILAAKNSAMFTSRCKSGNAERAANATDLWGSNKYDAPGLTEMYGLIPSRYSEIISACGDSSSRRSKSWIDKFNDSLTPALAQIWDKRSRALLAGTEPVCSLSANPQKLTAKQQETELDRLNSVNYELSLSSDLLEILKNNRGKDQPIPDETQPRAASELTVQARNCADSISAVTAAIEKSKAEEERKALEKASKEERIRLEKEYQRQRAAAAAARRAAQPSPNYRPAPPPPRARQPKTSQPTLPVWFEKKGGG